MYLLHFAVIIGTVLCLPVEHNEAVRSRQFSEAKARRGSTEVAGLMPSNNIFCLPRGLQH